MGNNRVVHHGQIPRIGIVITSIDYVSGRVAQSKQKILGMIPEVTERIVKAPALAEDAETAPFVCKHAKRPPVASFCMPALQ